MNVQVKFHWILVKFNNNNLEEAGQIIKSGTHWFDSFQDALWHGNMTKHYFVGQNRLGTNEVIKLIVEGRDENGIAESD